MKLLMREILCTRAKEHVKSSEIVQSTPTLNKKRSGIQNKNFFSVQSPLCSSIIMER